MQYFNIQVASQLSGVASATIRAWEKRYHAVKPERGDNKHRLYSEKDIEKLSLLSRLTELGQSIGKIAHLETEELKNIYSTLLHKPYDEKELVIPSQETLNIEEVLANFHLAIAAYKLDILSHEFEKTRDRLGPRSLCLDVLVPLYQQIGAKVDSGELSVAQEHALSAIASFHMGQVIGRHYQKSFQRTDLILIATPEGEFHEIGILASALLCVHHGLKFIFLGRSMPSEALAQAANALDATAILLGITKSTDLTHTNTFQDYLANLESLLKKKPSIWVGGNVKMSTKMELEKKKIAYFSSLHTFDEFLKNR
jgi:MerR family transcriptional regulator, light-induced transcriptional regulator